MSSRRYENSKGSSSSRDDFRRHRDRDHYTSRRRSRSRSPRRYSPDEKNSKYEEHSTKPRWSERKSQEPEEVPAPPPPPRITKISIGFNKQTPIKMKLGEKSKGNPLNNTKKVASVFNEDDDDEEPEEMPAEARMRMRNIGRETPTSAGPNSFGKTKQGFCDAKKVFEKNLKEALDTADRSSSSFKLPQTIYKIQP